MTIFCFDFLKDFSIPRIENQNDDKYGELDQPSLMLQQKMMEASGFLPVLNIFTTEFNNWIGNADNLTTKIILDEVTSKKYKIFMDIKYLPIAFLSHFLIFRKRKM